MRRIKDRREDCGNHQGQFEQNAQRIAHVADERQQATLNLLA